MGSIRRRLTATMVALGMSIGAVGVLAGCSSVERAGAAALVQGAVISQAELDTAVTELNAAQVDAAPPIVLAYLIASDSIEAIAATPGGWRPDESYNEFMATIEAPSPSTTRAVRANFAFNAMSDAGKAEVSRQLEELDIEVNPRYGTFDAGLVLVAPGAPDWIKPAEPVGNNEPVVPEPTAPATP